MLNFDNILQSYTQSPVQEAVAQIDLQFERLDQLLKADLSQLDSIDESLFIYFNREEVFYLNRLGRKLLKRRAGAFEPPTVLEPTPIFWLEPSLQRAADDLEVMMSSQPKSDVLELVSLAWGKTWMAGTKYPIRNTSGRSIAVLFSGKEIPAAEQIHQASKHCRITRKESGNN
tara:strand:+ start:414 stop:932 length:519 start_codon:yes stop_codon:yes gene_type:complete